MLQAQRFVRVHAAASVYIGPIIIKLTELGYPEDVQALDALSDAERRRFRMWQIAQQTHWDNMHYQYQQGCLDQEYYEDAFKDRVVRLAPTWQALGLTSRRRSFFAEIERLSREYGGLLVTRHSHKTTCMSRSIAEQY